MSRTCISASRFPFQAEQYLLQLGFLDLAEITAGQLRENEQLRYFAADLRECSGLCLQLDGDGRSFRYDRNPEPLQAGDFFDAARGSFPDLRHRLKYLFHARGREFDTAHIDEVSCPAGNAQNIVFGQMTDIAWIEPSLFGRGIVLRFADA